MQPPGRCCNQHSSEKLHQRALRRGELRALTLRDRSNAAVHPSGHLTQAEAALRQLQLGIFGKGGTIFEVIRLGSVLGY